jgi:beta-barrel assembly-enhancing protease
MNSRTNRILAILALSALLPACAMNPVTGKSDLMLGGESTELDIGQKQYSPIRQCEGGDYVLNPGVTYALGNIA